MGSWGKEAGWREGGACTQIANVWERADFHRREVRLNCWRSGAEVGNTLGLKTQPAQPRKTSDRGLAGVFFLLNSKLVSDTSYRNQDTVIVETNIILQHCFSFLPEILITF